MNLYADGGVTGCLVMGLNLHYRCFLSNQQLGTCIQLHEAHGTAEWSHMVVLVIGNKPYRLFVQSINRHGQCVVVMLSTRVGVRIFMFNLAICGQQSSNCCLSPSV